jgi:hypothetical protein
LLNIYTQLEVILLWKKLSNHDLPFRLLLLVHCTTEMVLTRQNLRTKRQYNKTATRFMMTVKLINNDKSAYNWREILTVTAMEDW